MAFFSAAQIETLSQREIRVALLAELEFESGDVNVWNGSSELTVGAKSYLPMRGTGRIDGLGEVGTDESRSVTMSVGALPIDGDATNEFLGAVLADTADVTQQFASINIVLFDSEWQPVGSTIPIFWGYMQPPELNRSEMNGESGGDQVASIQVENAFYNRSLPPHGRNTDRDQNARYPGDKFFSFVSSLLFKTITYPDY